MSQPPLPSDSSGTASKEGRFCFRPLSERRCRPGNLVGSCSGGRLVPPPGSADHATTPPLHSFFRPPFLSSLFRGACHHLFSFCGILFLHTTCTLPDFTS